MKERKNLPKKILNLEEKIFEVAWKLFSEEGYENVDMKAIAKGCGIAVGTLYNYYGNKKELFIKVLGASWSSTFEKINTEVEGIKDKKDYILKVIQILYADIKDRSGMGKYLIDSNYISKEEINTIQNEIISKIYLILMNGIEYQESSEEREYKVKKLTHLIICNVVLLARLYPKDDEANIQFLSRIVNENSI